MDFTFGTFDRFCIITEQKGTTMVANEKPRPPLRRNGILARALANTHTLGAKWTSKIYYNLEIYRQQVPAR